MIDQSHTDQDVRARRKVTSTQQKCFGNFDILRYIYRRTVISIIRITGYIMPARKAAPPVPAAAPTNASARPGKNSDQLEYFLKGTVLKRMMKCGHPQCACHRDPAQRHGPYFEWTYKVNGKTVNVKLSPQAAPLYSGRHQTAP